MGEALKLFNKKIKKLEIKYDNTTQESNQGKGGIKKEEGAVTKDEIMKTYKELLEKFKSNVPPLIIKAEKRINDNIKKSAGAKSTILRELGEFQAKAKKIIDKFDNIDHKLHPYCDKPKPGQSVDLKESIHTIKKELKRLLADNYGLATMKTLTNRVRKALKTFSETKKLYIEGDRECDDLKDLPMKNDDNSCEKFISYMKKLAGEDEKIYDDIGITQEDLKQVDIEIQDMLNRILKVKNEYGFPKTEYNDWVTGKITEGNSKEEIKEKIISAYKVIRLFNLFFKKRKRFLSVEERDRRDEIQFKVGLGVAVSPLVLAAAAVIIILSPLILIAVVLEATKA